MSDGNNAEMVSLLRDFYHVLENALAACASDPTIEADIISGLGDQLDGFIYLVNQVRCQRFQRFHV